MTHHNVKVYDGETGRERETIRGLTFTQSLTLKSIFEREGIQAQSMDYDDEGKFIGDRTWSVNWDDGIVQTKQ